MTHGSEQDMEIWRPKVENVTRGCDFHVPRTTVCHMFVAWPTTRTHARTHARACLTALCPGLPGWTGTRKVKLIWILLKQETVSGSGINWVVCKSAPLSRQITMPAPHHSVFYRPDALPAVWSTTNLKLYIIFWDGGETWVSILCHLKMHTDLITVRG